MRSNVIGNYRELRKLAFDKSSIGVGIGHNGKGKFDARKGFVEYNPNKLSNEGLELIQRLKTRFERRGEYLHLLSG